MERGLVVVLKWVDGCTYEEIGRAGGISRQRAHQILVSWLDFLGFGVSQVKHSAELLFVVRNAVYNAALRRSKPVVEDSPEEFYLSEIYRSKR